MQQKHVPYNNWGACICADNEHFPTVNCDDTEQWSYGENVRDFYYVIQHNLGSTHAFASHSTFSLSLLRSRSCTHFAAAQVFVYEQNSLIVSFGVRRGTFTNTETHPNRRASFLLYTCNRVAVMPVPMTSQRLSKTFSNTHTGTETERERNMQRAHKFGVYISIFTVHNTHGGRKHTIYHSGCAFFFCDSDHAHRQFEWAHAICFCYFFFLFVSLCYCCCCCFWVFFLFYFVQFQNIFFCCCSYCCFVYVLHIVHQRDTYVLLFDTAVVGIHIIKYLYDKNVLHYTSTNFVSFSLIFFVDKINLFLILFTLVIYYL